MAFATVVIVRDRGPWAPRFGCVEQSELASVRRSVFGGQQVTLQPRVEADTHVPADTVVVAKHCLLVGDVGGPSRLLPVVPADKELVAVTREDGVLGNPREMNPAGLIHFKAELAYVGSLWPPSRLNQVSVDIVVARASVVLTEVQKSRDRQSVFKSKGPVRLLPGCPMIRRTQQFDIHADADPAAAPPTCKAHRRPK